MKFDSAIEHLRKTQSLVGRNTEVRKEIWEIYESIINLIEFIKSEYNKKISEKNRENARLRDMVDALLNHCDKEGGECSECAKIVCPYKDPLHFHHDGCPSCAESNSGPYFSDGHDWEGFKGGCERFGCPPGCSKPEED